MKDGKEWMDLINGRAESDQCEITAGELARLIQQSNRTSLVIRLIHMAIGIAALLIAISISRPRYGAVFLP